MVDREVGVGDRAYKEITTREFSVYGSPFVGAFDISDTDLESPARRRYSVPGCTIEVCIGKNCD
ncbi:hypothetical protein D6779_01365 [Candidatus Parcubacteria bacterium]|nr:MAG: hypothetical protein D6779_01365 [Candidatus Parcubacteria bacterium]